MKTYLIIVALVSIALLSSCVVQETAVLSEPEPVATIEEMEQESYRIQPGDQLEIKFFYNSDLNTSVVVRPDGKIALQLAGEVQAAGLTLAELHTALTESFGNELLNPEITINLSGFQGLRIYVGGEVYRQGFFEFRNGMTPLQAVLNAGGFKDFADPAETVVIRKDQNNRPVSIVVDLAKVLKGSNDDSDLLLLPDDVIYVPKR